MARLNKKQKAEIKSRLDNRASFNMFGIVNLSVIQGELSFDITKLRLKNHINKVFAHEMVTGKIEFIGK